MQRALLVFFRSRNYRVGMRMLSGDVLACLRGSRLLGGDVSAVDCGKEFHVDAEICRDRPGTLVGGAVVTNRYPLTVPPINSPEWNFNNSWEVLLFSRFYPPQPPQRPR